MPELIHLSSSVYILGSSEVRVSEGINIAVDCDHHMRNADVNLSNYIPIPTPILTWNENKEPQEQMFGSGWNVRAQRSNKVTKK